MWITNRHCALCGEYKDVHPGSLKCEGCHVETERNTQSLVGQLLRGTLTQRQEEINNIVAEENEATSYPSFREQM